MSGTSILKKFSIANNSLKGAYAQGKISYPRVANDYITLKDIKFYEYPHKALVSFDSYSTPLKEEEYLVSKATLPLLLTHKNISTPATLLKNLEFVDYFLNDKMELRDNALDIEEKLASVMSLFRCEVIDFHRKEVSENLIARGTPPEELEDTELLSYISKDGGAFLDFKQEIMPYTLYLSPEQCVNLSNADSEHSHGENNLFPLTSPSVYKTFSSPTRSLNSELLSESVEVSDFEMLLDLEDIRLRDANIKEKLSETEGTRKTSLNNAMEH